MLTTTFTFFPAAVTIARRYWWQNKNSSSHIRTIALVGDLRALGDHQHAHARRHYCQQSAGPSSRHDHRRERPPRNPFVEHLSSPADLI
ncbi:hypothetical protein BC828DRAFT_378343 [Blastocladiella britannica]|nr:hypothetical protein BC828DRAFT_378343 [Blastocladiella britannica]